MPNETNAVTVSMRAVQSQDTDLVRDLMLEMLAEAPHAFGEALAEAKARSPQDWMQFVDHLAAGSQRIAFLAFDPAGACGFVYADLTVPEAPPGMAVISRLWVAPRKRGTGLGRALMDAATTWVESQGADGIGLGITETNTRVIPFYERLGYRDTGVRFPPRDDPGRQIMIMGRRLKE